MGPAIGPSYAIYLLGYTSTVRKLSLSSIVDIACCESDSYAIYEGWSKSHRPVLKIVRLTIVLGRRWTELQSDVNYFPTFVGPPTWYVDQCTIC
jgi:hypothetical protein